jgi:hypothetical protein
MRTPPRRPRVPPELTARRLELLVAALLLCTAIVEKL